MFIRGIMTLLLNAHLVSRIVDLNENDITRARSYRWLKRKLNKKRTFQKFLAIMADDWTVAKEEVAGQEEEAQEVREPVEQVVLPKRNLVKFFNKNEAARRMRLDGQDHMKTTESKRQCIICYRMKNGKKKRMETTVKCSKCGVYLCTRRKLLPSGNIAHLSCWDRHHTQARLTTFEFVCRRAVDGRLPHGVASDHSRGEASSNLRRRSADPSEFQRVTRSRRREDRNRRYALRRSLRHEGRDSIV